MWRTSKRYSVPWDLPSAVFRCVLILAVIGLTFFIVACMMLSFGFRIKKMSITQWCFSCCWSVLTLGQRLSSFSKLSLGIRSRHIFFPLRVLNSVEHSSVEMGQATECCSDLHLSGIASDSIFFQTLYQFSGFCTCSEVKFQNSGSAHCSTYLFILSPTPWHS